MFCQTMGELVSPVQATWQVAPTMKESPGAGAIGTTSARTRKDVAKTRSATEVFVENICFFFGPARGGV